MTLTDRVAMPIGAHNEYHEMISKSLKEFKLKGKNNASTFTRTKEAQEQKREEK